METLETPTEPMQSLYLFPQGQPSGSKLTHAAEEALCSSSATQLDMRNYCAHTLSARTMSGCVPDLRECVPDWPATKVSHRRGTSSHGLSFVIWNLFAITINFNGWGSSWDSAGPLREPADVWWPTKTFTTIESCVVKSTVQFSQTMDEAQGPLLQVSC